MLPAFDLAISYAPPGFGVQFALETTDAVRTRPAPEAREAISKLVEDLKADICQRITDARECVAARKKAA
jgi:hypothetical protein